MKNNFNFFVKVVKNNYKFKKIANGASCTGGKFNI